MPLESPPVPVLVLALVFACLWGMNTGSFLNVVVHRLPLGLSVVRPRSRCPACRTRIRAVDNVPVLSWALLGARCRGCKGRISFRYPAVELFTGGMAVHVAWVIAFEPGAWGSVRAWSFALCVFCVSASLLAAALIDADHRILPDQITKPGMWAAPALAAFFPEFVLGPSSVAPGWVPEGLPLPIQAALVSVAGIVTGAGVIWVLGKAGTRIFKKDAMGFGDVKFLGMIGGLVGPAGAILALVLASVVGTVWGPLRMLFTRDERIPFGPFLALGAYVTLLYGDRLVGWYLDTLTGGF